MKAPRAELGDASQGRLGLEALEPTVRGAHGRDLAGAPVRERHTSDDGGCEPVLQTVERQLSRDAAWETFSSPRRPVMAG